MANKLDLSFSTIYDTCLCTMCCYITTLAKSELDFFDFVWQDDAFSFQSVMQTYGTISFDVKSQFVVGAFRYSASKRIGDYPQMDALSLFETSDQQVKAMAENTVLFRLKMGFEIPKRGFESKVKEIVVPVATTAFWGSGNAIYSCDSQDDFIRHGGRYLCELCRFQNRLHDELIDYFDMSEEDVSFSEELISAKKGNRVLRRECVAQFIDMDKLTVPFVNALKNLGLSLE